MIGLRTRIYLLMTITLTSLRLSRLPAQDFLLDSFIWSGSVLVVAATIISTQMPSHDWARRLAAVMVTGILLAPPSPDSLLWFLPGWVPPILVLMFLHHLLVDEEALTEEKSRPATSALRFLAPSLIIGAVFGLPAILPYLLPERLAVMFEIRSALGPIIVASAICSVLVVTALILAATNHKSGPDAHAAKEVDPDA